MEDNSIFWGRHVSGADEETIREGYYKLGILSTTYAALEQRIQNYISARIGLVPIFGDLLIEGNSLEKNRQIMEKVYKVNGGRESALKSLTTRIMDIQGDRNKLIHGIWKIEFNGKLNEPQVSISQGKVIQGFHGVQQFWTNVVHHYYTFNQIDELIDKLKKIDADLRDMFPEQQ